MGCLGGRHLGDTQTGTVRQRSQGALQRHHLTNSPRPGLPKLGTPVTYCQCRATNGAALPELTKAYHLVDTSGIWVFSHACLVVLQVLDIRQADLSSNDSTSPGSLYYLSVPLILGHEAPRGWVHTNSSRLSAYVSS